MTTLHIDAAIIVLALYTAQFAVLLIVGLVMDWVHKRRSDG